MTFDKPGRIGAVSEALANAGMIFLHPPVFIQHALAKVLPLLGTSMATEQLRTIAPEPLFEQLNAVKGLRVLPRQGTYFASVLLDLACYPGIPSDQVWARKLLEDQNVRVLPLSLFGPICGFRLPITLKQELSKDLINRLQ